MQKKIIIFIITILVTLTLVSCGSKTVVELNITEPTKIMYEEGEAFDYTGLVIEAVFEDGTIKVIPNDKLTFTGFNSNVFGTQVINVIYKEASATFNVLIIGGQEDDQIKSLEVLKDSINEFLIGDQIEEGDLKIEVSFYDGTKKILSMDQFTILGFDSSTSGNRTITINYGGKHVTHNIIISKTTRLSVVKTEITNKLNTYKISSSNQEYISYFNDVKDDLINQVNSETELNKLKLFGPTAELKLNDVVKASDEEVYADWIKKTKNPFPALQPKFTNLPKNEVLKVSRGYRGDIINYFNISGVNALNEDISSLISYESDLNINLTGNYDIAFIIEDQYGNKAKSDNYQLNIERIDIEPTIEIYERTAVLNSRTVTNFDPLFGVLATDGTGLNLTENIVLVYEDGFGQEVDFFEHNPGYYKIIYNVEDTDGNSSSDYKEVTILPTSSASTDSGLVEVNGVTPYLSFFNSTSVKEWEPTGDEEYVNIATIPLQERINGESINPNANKDVKVAILDQITEQVNGLQYYTGFDEYMIEYYQYMDIAVSWNGSGNITAPTREVINAFHKNGVKILGNIFMKPKVYGGSDEQQNALIEQNEAGDFLVADKLIEIANYLGFDGWFINLETEGANAEIAQKFHEFNLYYQRKLVEKEYTQEIFWYDSMIKSGPIRWQGTLNENNELFFGSNDSLVTNSMFLDFRWDGRYGDNGLDIIKNGANYAKKLGRSQYDLFTGFDTQQYGLDKSSSTGTPWQWNKYFDTSGNPYTSMGIYMSSWTFAQDGVRIRDKDNKWQQPAKYSSFKVNANNMWVGPEGNPRKTNVDLINKPNTWYGVSSFVNAKTAIIGDNYYTSFNTGNGHQFYKNGNVVTEYENGYNNLDTQDILPTWRWINENVGTDNEVAPLNIDLVHDEAYNGGSSLLISGDLSNKNDTDFLVYKTYLDIYEDTSFGLIYKSNNEDVINKVRLTFENSNGWYEDIVYLTIDKVNGESWNDFFVSLGNYSGKKLTSIGFKVEANNVEVDDYNLRLGEMAIYRDQDIYNDDIANINNVELVSSSYQYGIYGDARVKWDKVENNLGFVRYEVYSLSKDDKLTYLTSSYSNYVYIKDIKRGVYEDEYSNTETLLIEAYDILGKKIATSNITYNWEEPIKGGRAQFTVDSTLIKEGGKVTFTPIKSPITTTLEWTFEGVEENNITYHDDGSVTVLYEVQGLFDVTLKAINDYGTETLVSKNLILVSTAASSVSNITNNARLHSYSGYVVANEHPRYMLDNDRGTKWCETTATTPGNKWVIMDLQDQFTISRFQIFHAGIAESISYNTVEFEIHVTNEDPEDKNTLWEIVVRVENNKDSETSHPVTPVEARYVKLVIINGGSDNASRIYEFRIFGR